MLQRFQPIQNQQRPMPTHQLGQPGSLVVSRRRTVRSVRVPKELQCLSNKHRGIARHPRRSRSGRVARALAVERPVEIPLDPAVLLASQHVRLPARRDRGLPRPADGHQRHNSGPPIAIGQSVFPLRVQLSQHVVATFEHAGVVRLGQAAECDDGFGAGGVFVRGGFGSARLSFGCGVGLADICCDCTQQSLHASLPFRAIHIDINQMPQRCGVIDREVRNFAFREPHGDQVRIGRASLTLRSDRVADFWVDAVEIPCFRLLRKAHNNEVGGRHGLADGGAKITSGRKVPVPENFDASRRKLVAQLLRL